MQKNIISILGCSPYILPLLVDMIDDIFGEVQIQVLQNILPSKKPQSPSVSFYDCYNDEKPALLLNDCIFCISGPSTKKTLFNYFLNQLNVHHSQYINLIHPKSYIAGSVILNKGIQVEPNVTIQSMAEIGFGVHIKRNCAIGHHTTIGDYTSINPGAIINGCVEIGSGVEIGAGAIIRNLVTIGANTTIGMGSVVTKSMPANVIAYGNPCSVKSYKT